MIGPDIAQLATANGPALALLVGQGLAVLGELSDADRLELVKATVRVEAWTASVRARAIIAVHESAEADIAAVRAELDQAAAEVAQARRTAGLPARRTVSGASHAFEDRRLLARRVGGEVAFVLGVSTVAADREVDLALDLAAHPPMRRALAEGLLDRTQAVTILDGAMTMPDPAQQRRLMAALLGPDDSPDGDDFDPDEVAGDQDEAGDPIPPVRELSRPRATLWALTPARLRHILRREVAAADPAAAAERASAARMDRRVSFQSAEDCMAELWLRTTAPEGVAAYDNLDQSARAVKAAGDSRSLDQLRADIAIGWLTEGAFGTYITRPAMKPAGVHLADVVCLPPARRPILHLTAPETTMAGLDDEPGILHGPRGPIPVPADLARQIGYRAGTRWRTLRYDPRTGIATDLSRSYRPPPLMAEFVKARDGWVTRTPTSCATHLELDHVREYRGRGVGTSTSGPTTPANLASQGQRDHHLKTDRVTTITGNANHTLTITTPSGRSYPSEPYLHAEPSLHAGPSG